MTNRDSSRRPAGRPRAALPFPALLAVAALAAGCTGLLQPRPDPTRFWVLRAAAGAPGVAAAAATRHRSYGVGPVGIPDYLKRPGVITRASGARVEPSAIDRWAEPLDKGVPRVLAENLRLLLGTDRIVLYPWYASSRPDLQVAIGFEQFERGPDGEALLAATWTIRRTGDGATLRTGETRTRIAPGTPDTEGAVLAQGEALAALAREIAAAIEALPAR